MKRLFINIFLSIISILSATSLQAAGLTFGGQASTPVAADVEASTGLTTLYVVPSLAGNTISYTASGQAPIVWSAFNYMGGGYAHELQGVSRNGNTYTITSDGSDAGYIIDDGSKRYCFWVINYANHELNLHSVEVATENDCDRTTLIINGSGAPIYYYSINGRRIELSRDIKITYRTLQYDNDSEQYAETVATETLASLGSAEYVPAPLTDTEFTVSGDRFLEAWGRGQEIVSPLFNTNAVDAHTTAIQTATDYDNEQKDGDMSALGGSAPCEITFKAVCSDAVVFKEWQMSATPDFDVIDDRFNQDIFTHTFNQNGTTYVKFVAGNAAGTCMQESDTYTVSIGESSLECPNAFSPANQDGVNDLWKVSYKSIVSFECNIFNRWGKKLCTLNHPSQGWDGKVGSKFVPSGVYFYVIKARGADGKEYNLSGDINIINSRANLHSTPGDVE